MGVMMAVAHEQKMDTPETLGAEASARWQELDQLCRIPDDLRERALVAGLFRTLVPAEMGGAGAGPAEWFRIGLTLASGNPALGWVVTQGAAELGWIAAGGDDTWAREVLDDPLGCSASTIAGSGKVLVGDPSKLEGRWAFNTGVHGATWVGGAAVVVDPSKPDGRPDIRMAWVPASRAEIVDDWDPVGMRGTGSNSIVIADQEIDLRWTFNPLAPSRNERGAHRCVCGNGSWPIATSVAATQLGAARRAIAEAIEIVHVKAPPPEKVRLAENSAVQRALIELEGRWNAARAGVEQQLESMWEQAHHTGGDLSKEQRLQLFAANAHADAEAVRIVNDVCELTGTAALDPSSPLARCRRDTQALRGHISTSGATAEKAGKIRLGVVDDHPYV
jgi:alkylation response protein AidB-like acyl-CoA dehydrogenase